MSNGKGRGPEKGRNLAKYEEGYVGINWHHNESPMKSMSQVLKVSACPETLDEARGIIDSLEQDRNATREVLKQVQHKLAIVDSMRLRQERELIALRNNCGNGKN